MRIKDPQESLSLIGHDAVVREVEEALSSGRMHHAWMIAGPEGIGKATLAYHIAQHVLANGRFPIRAIDPEDRSARLVSALSHPDLFLLARKPDEKTGVMGNVIPVDEARKLDSFLRVTPSFGGWRVAIIDEAHCLNTFGQNAILKAIEEPPARSLILMTVTTPGVLVPTIRSRCRLVQLSPLSQPELRAVLAAAGGEGEDWEPILPLAGGSAGFALKIAETGCLELYGALKDLLAAMPGAPVGAIHALADKIGKKADKDSFAILTKLLKTCLFNDIRLLATEKPEEAALRLPLDRALQLWDKIDRIFAAADQANLDHKLAFINAITEMDRALAA